jgi:hypothetical protein
VTVLTGNGFTDFRFWKQPVGRHRVEWRMANSAPLVLSRIGDAQNFGNPLRPGGFKRRVWPHMMKITGGPNQVMVPSAFRPAMTAARTATLRAEELGRRNIRVRVARPTANRMREKKGRNPQPVRGDLARICSPVTTARE